MSRNHLPVVVGIIVALIQKEPNVRGHGGGYGPLGLQTNLDAVGWCITSHDCHCHAHHLSNLMQHEGLANDHDSHPLLSLQQMYTHYFKKEKKGIDGSFV